MKMASSFCYHSFLTLFVLLFCVYMPIVTMCFKMKLIPRVDIDPILFPKNISEEEKHNRLIQISKIHALNHLKSKTNITISTLSNFQPMLESFGSSFYLVEMMIGSPISYQPKLLLDTGSDDTWVQCENCIKPYCFPIKYGNYKYTESRTRNLVYCDDPLCVPKMCSSISNMCLYGINYPGGEITAGLVLTENFTFPDSNSEDVKNKHFVNFMPTYFGCGVINRNMKFSGHMDSTNIVGGIFGLGTGPRSFLSQWSDKTKMRFFYCLSSQTQPNLSEPPSFIYFGDDAKISGDFKTTQLLSKLGDVKLKRYFVTCTGISLSGTMLSIPPETFELKPGGKGGFFIDLGSYATVLTKSVYQVLKQNVIAYFEQKGFHPYALPSSSSFDLCYINVTNDVVKPIMSYHFEGDAEFEVDPNSLFENVGNLLCLGVVSLEDDNGPNILGARQQQNHTFLFDAQNNQVSFSPKAISCSDYQTN